jgi:tetratricopeptide (TPR) repeat protein
MVNRVPRIRALVLAAAALLVLLGRGPGEGARAGAPSYRQIDAAAEAYLHYSLGRLMEVRGLLKDALVQFRRAASLDPGHCEVEVAIGRTLLAAGRPAAGRSAMARALEICPDDLEAVAGLATAHMVLDDAAAAARVLDAPARRPSAPEELVVLLAQALLADARVHEAADLYAARAARDTLSPRIAFLHAQTLLALDRPDDALGELGRSRRLDPTNRTVTAALGRLMIARERQREGVVILEELLSESPGFEPEYVALARGYSELGEHDSAIAAIEKALAEFGETPSLLGALGSVRFGAGDTDGALAAYEGVLEIAPESVHALNFLAYTLADEDLDPARAVGYAEQAVELDPENGFVRDTLGWAYYKLGRFAEAREEIETAIELGGAEAVIYEHLGDVLRELGLIEDALSAWSRALELEPGRPTVLERMEAAGEEGRPGEKR